MPDFASPDPRTARKSSSNPLTVVRFEPVHNEAAAHAKTAGNGAALGELGALTGTLDAPDEASAGATLHYTVTLSNSTAKAISPAACPAYTQALYVDGKAVDTALRRDCGVAGAQIAANASVSFDMQATVPAAPAGATLKLSWKLQDGRGGGKLINLR